MTSLPASKEAPKLKVLVFTSKGRNPDLSNLYANLGSQLALDLRVLDKEQQCNLRKQLRDIDLTGFDRVLLDLPFKNIRSQSVVLSKVSKLVIYEEDACQNYLSNSRWKGKFSRLYKRLPHARILVTGASVAERLRKEGFAVSFAPKGYDSATVYLQLQSKNIELRDIELGFIGRTSSAAYAQRKSLLEQLAATEPLQLLRTEPGAAYRQMLNRIRMFISADVGLDEYMAKNFEAMACGCVLLAWRQGFDEQAIGLQDGEHLLLYSSLDELRAHIAALRCDPLRAQKIANAGRTFVEAHLSYECLAKRMAALLAEPWPAMPAQNAWRAVWQRLRIFRF